MGLLATRLSMADFRSFTLRELVLGPAITVLVGPNAAGKTNTVEALQLLTAGVSFRHPQPAQLVHEGSKNARIDLRLEGDGRVLDARMDAAVGSRKFSRNGKPCRSADMSSELMSVLFCPDDLALIKRGASVRREELDVFGCQANKGYYRLVKAYQRSVEQRNRLLREPYPDLALLDAWDASVAAGGSALLDARLRLFTRLAERTCEIYAEVSRGEILTCSYISSLGEASLSMNRDEVADAMVAALLSHRSDDLRLQRTSVGPHRDDFLFCIGGREARSFASQGQQRTIALALKMAEVGLAAEVLKQQPLLLLDDVMSELDASRRDALAGFVGSGIQTVITTTNLGYFSDDMIEVSEVINFDK